MLLLLIITAIFAIPAACVLFESYTAPGYGPDSVLFIEHLNHTRGRLVSGQYPPGYLDRVEYQFDAEKGMLFTSARIGLHDSLTVLLGIGQSLVEDAGSGAANSLYAINTDQAVVDGITLEEVFQNGSVRLSYGGRSIFLAPGERWEIIGTDDEKSSDYYIRLIHSDSIRNNGFVSRACIKPL